MHGMQMHVGLWLQGSAPVADGSGYEEHHLTGGVW